MMRWTSEQLAWLAEAYTRMIINEIIHAAKDELGIELTYNQVNGATSRYKMQSGRTGQFVKGGTPWNTGKRGYMGANRTSFKPGNLPHNANPLWHEREDRDGYIELHVPERNPWTGYKYRYKGKHVWLWEQATGRKLPRGHAVIFRDGNRRNFDIDNLVLVTRSQLLALNRHRYHQQPDELKPSIFALAMMEEKAKINSRYTRGCSRPARWVTHA